MKKINTNFREAIQQKKRLSVTSRFLVTGDSFEVYNISLRFRNNLCPLLLKYACDAILEVLKDYVKLPETEEQWLAGAKEFEEKWNFPHVIGALEGKHVYLQAPCNSGTGFYNYKSFYSIVPLALVDAEYNFVYVSK